MVGLAWCERLRVAGSLIGKMQPSMILEDRLCALLAQGFPTDAARHEMLDLLSDHIRCEQLFRRAEQHEVLPLVVKNWRSLGYPGVNSNWQERFEAAFRVNAFRNALLAEELATLLNDFHQQGIPVIPLKGLLLSQFLYGEESLRVCSDMDLLVPPGLVPAALRLFTSQGYRPEVPAWVPVEQLTKITFECPLSRRSAAVHFLAELHWGFARTGKPDEGQLRELLSEATREQFRGVPVLILSPEWQLLFLSVHATRHNWQGLKWLVDIHDLCQSGRVKWERALQKSQDLGWDRIVRWSLSVCHSILGTPLPAGMPFELPLPASAYYPAAPRTPRGFSALGVLLRMGRTPSEKLQLALQGLVRPVPADALIPLPARWRFLYYFFRPLRLAYSRLRSALSPR
jgi:hypothetical protein